MQTKKYEITARTQLIYNVIQIYVKPIDNILPKNTVSSFARIYTDDYTISRPYTPTEIDIHKLTMEFTIKTYENGKVSQFLNQKKIGEFLNIEFPLNKRIYKANEFKNVLCIAGGSGITPCIQLLQARLDNIEDNTNFTLIFCNVSDKDIFLVDRINNYSSFCTVLLFVDKQKKEDGKYYSGRITEKILKDICFDRHINRFDFVYVCGPPSMLEFLGGKKNEDKTQGKLTGVLKNLGFNEENVYKF